MFTPRKPVTNYMQKVESTAVEANVGEPSATTQSFWPPYPPHHPPYPPRPPHPPSQCPQLPGTVLRLYIPAGAALNLLNIIELSSPSGVCLNLRLPIFGGGNFGGTPVGGFGSYDLNSIINTVKQAGGSVEVIS